MGQRVPAPIHRHDARVDATGSRGRQGWQRFRCYRIGRHSERLVDVDGFGANRQRRRALG